VLRVYKEKGFVIVDRVLYYPDKKPNEKPNLVDVVYLQDVINYPIILGKKNPKKLTDVSESFLSSAPTLNAPEATARDALISQPSISPAEVSSNVKRLRSEILLISEAKNTKSCASRLQKKRTFEIDTITDVKSAEAFVSATITEWSFDHVPDIFWQEVESDNIISFDTNSSEIIFSADERDHGMRTYETEPRSHSEAMKRSSEKEYWIAAERKEMDSLERLNFAEIVDIPEGAHLLPCIWVYKYKTNELGERVLYKARIVARGDQAIAGVEYHETYSPVAKLESIRLALALIISFKLIPLQLVIGTAYIWADLEEPVFLRSIPGQQLPAGKCYRVLKSIYGMPQAGRNWNNLFSGFLVEFEFIPIREDLCLFILHVNGVIVAIIVIYVDDVLAGFDSLERRDWFVTIISGRFDVKVIGLPTNLLGLKLEWTPVQGELYFSAVKITNIKSVNVLINYFDLSTAKDVFLPYNISSTLSKSQCPTTEQRADLSLLKMQSDYRTAVGAFIWLQCTTRPDIMPIVLILSQFVANPAWQHYQAALWLIKYLKTTIDLGIVYSFDSSPQLLGYVDADHASHEDRRSRYYFIFMLAGGPIFWKNGFETRFALSTAESEVRAIYALREAIKHILYLRKVFNSL